MTNSLHRSYRKAGIAIPIVLMAIVLLLGMAFVRYKGSENFRESTISDKDRKFLTQKALTATDIIRKRTLNYVHNLTNTYNPQAPISITTISAAAIGFELDPGESITLECLGQGDFKFSSPGGTLAPCDNNPKIYPKVFAISYTGRGSDRGVVSSLDQTFEIGPEGLNRFSLVVSGSTNPRIGFKGGYYGAPVILAFDPSVAADAALQFINPPNKSVIFSEPVYTNADPQASYFGLGSYTTQVNEVGPVEFQKGYVQFGPDYSPKPINMTEAMQDPAQFTVTQTGVPANSVVKSAIVYIGGASALDRCNFQIVQQIETKTCTRDNTSLQSVCSSYVQPPPSTSNTAVAPPTQEIKLDIFPKKTQYAGVLGAPINLFSSLIYSMVMGGTTTIPTGTGTGTGTSQTVTTTDDATDTGGTTDSGSSSSTNDNTSISQSDTTAINACVSAITTATSKKALFAGGKFYIWTSNYYKPLTIADAQTQYCPTLSLSTTPPATVKPDDCVTKYKALSNRLAGYSKNGEIQTCTTTTTTHSFPSSAGAVTSDAIYWVSATEQVTLQPFSGSYMSVCDKFTIVTDAPSTILKASILQSSQEAANAGISDPKNPDFSPSPMNKLLAVVAKRGDIVIASDFVPLTSQESPTLLGLKALNVPESVKNVVIQGALVAEQGSPFRFDESLMSRTNTGTVGAAETYGILLGKEAPITGSIVAYGASVLTSGASVFNTNYNSNFETDPPSSFEFSSETSPLVATVVTQNLGFTDVNRAIADAEARAQP